MEEEIEELEKDMTPVLLEDLGMRFATEKSKSKYRYGLYKCQYCGKEFEARTSHINSEGIKSCGCLIHTKNSIINKTHGLGKHPLYQTWNSMQTRCYNKNNKNYKNYGTRGIQVCERWLDVRNFIEDMYPSWEEGLSLDRIDVNGKYEPNNCRWVKLNIQARNTRDIMITNTSGFRGVSWHKGKNSWSSYITINKKKKHLGSFHTALEAAKAYERYVRLNNLEHNFTPALTEEEIEKLNKQKEEQNENNTKN